MDAELDAHGEILVKPHVHVLIFNKFLQHFQALLCEGHTDRLHDFAL